MKPACMDPDEYAAWQEANRTTRGEDKADSPCRDCLPLFHRDMTDGGMCDGVPTRGQPSSAGALHPRYLEATILPHIEGAP